LIFQPATVGAATYAIRETQTAAATDLSAPITMDLAVSHDGLRTWKPIDMSLAGPADVHYLPQQFWIDPSHGGLLLEAWDQVAGALALWHSEDSGAHWRPFGQAPASVSGGATGSGGFVVQPPAAGQPWTVCLSAYDATGEGANSLACTTDGGASWAARSALNVAADATPVPGKGPGPSIGAAEVFALTDDSALLALTGPSVHANGGSFPDTLYRLAAGAVQWQSLGLVPQVSLFYAPAPGNGSLWALPAPQVSLDARNRVFTAALSIQR
jgi:hypothetical protein